MQEYSLQLARAADARRLASMSQELVEAGLRPAWSAPRISWHMRHPESIVLTARHAGTPVGFGVMRFAEEDAHLNLLAVDPVHQRRGLAKATLVWLEETALTAGTFNIELELRATNTGAFAFYSALGYHELGRVAGYYQGVEPAIRMSRDVRAQRVAVAALKPRRPV